MVPAEKCLQLKVRETGQRGGSGQINNLSDARQYGKPGSWLHKSPFPEVVAIHQTLNSSIDPGWLSCAPRATPGLWEKGTAPITRLDGHELVSVEPPRTLCRSGIYWPKPTPPFPLMSKGGRCNHPTGLSCLCRAGWRRWTIEQRGSSLVRNRDINETRLKGRLLNCVWSEVCRLSFSSGCPSPEKMDRLKLG